MAGGLDIGCLTLAGTLIVTWGLFLVSWILSIEPDSYIGDGTEGHR